MSEAGELQTPFLRPATGVLVVPIRHHSPACAEGVAALIEREKPSRILIEMPADFEHHVPILLDERTRPPVAIVALARRGEGSEAEEIAGSYPFSIHSPEFVAIREGSAAGADIRFIDLPSGTRLRNENHDGGHADAPPAAPLATDDGLEGSDYVAALADRMGCRDGFEVWDRLFESRLGAVEPDPFFDSVAAYCAAIRATVPRARIEADDTLAREQAMVAHLSRAMRERKEGEGPILVLVGGFHAPPIAEAAKRIAAGETADDRLPPSTGARSWLTRFGMRELDALNAYGAGLPVPGYYDTIWNARPQNGAPDWSGVMRDILQDFRRLAPEALTPSLPAAVEAMRLAEGLATMRGLPGPMRAEIEDAARTAFLKGEGGRGLAGYTDPIVAALREHLTGNTIGDVPPSAGSPPLLEAVREQARAHRFDVEDGARRTRTLDIRRNPRHARISAFLHGLELIGVEFASLQSGPDFAAGTRTDLVNETWETAWSHRVEAKLIERAVLGSTLPAACIRALSREFDALAKGHDARDSGAAVALLGRGAIAGLGQALAPLAGRVEATLAEEPRFAGAANALRRLNALERGTAALAKTLPFDAGSLAETAYRRLLALVPDLGETAPERTDEVVGAMREARNASQDHEDDDEGDTAFMRAIRNLAARRDARNPAIAGSALALAAMDEVHGRVLVDAVRGTLGGIALDPGARVNVLRGAIAAEPSVLWSVPGLLDAVDAVLSEFDEDGFLAVLPDLRLAFTALNPRETDRVAEALSDRHGAPALTLSAHREASLTEVAAASAIDAALVEAMRTDGLGAWLEDG